MNRFAILLLAATAFAQPPRAEDEKTLLRIEREWTEADTKKDLAVIDRTVAEDWVGTFSDGIPRDKRWYIASVKEPATSRVAAHVENVKVRFVANVAIITGITVKQSDTGKIRRDAWTDVFTKRDGRWQCVSSHDAEVRP